MSRFSGFSLLLALIALTMPSTLSQADSAQERRYPADFLWGVAFSAHQTEGLAGGGENGDWYRFEHRRRWYGKRTIDHGDTADLAADFWNRYPEDLELARALGMQTIRTSLAWEKIEPRPGEFNTEVLAHYRAVFRKMRELGIKPMIALHHFTHPLWFHRQGGWTNPESSRWFLRYAERVVQELGPECDLWLTFNEPVVLVLLGYLQGVFPPAKISLHGATEAAWNLARAHRRVAAMIHRVQGPSPSARGADGNLRGVGLASSTQYYDPYRPGDARDVEVASALEDIANWAFLRAVETGKLAIRFPRGALLKGFERELPAEDIPAAQRSEPFQDFIGINYYNRFLIQHSRLNPLGFRWRVSPEDPKSDNGWAIYPAGLEKVLRRAARFGRPLVVTENGLADASDTKRPAFIRDHLRMVDRAIQGSELGGPLDVRGYYAWSLTDNFEWVRGFQHRFGLVEIRYDDGLRRVPRASAYLYSEEITARKSQRGNTKRR